MATFPIPADAWNDPTPQDLDRNADYWTAYESTKPIAQRLLPNPGDFAKYGDSALAQFDLAVLRLTLTAAMKGFPVASADGHNECLWDGAGGLWRKDPNSPHNKAS